MALAFERKTPLPDDALKQAQGGDPDALRRLLEPCAATIFRLAYRIAGTAEDAEDLTQEALVRIIERLPSFRGECAFPTWAYRIALNACLSDRRRRQPSPVDLSGLSLPDPAPGPEAQALRSELRERARRELDRLRPAYREAIALRVFGELSYEEMAALLGVTENVARLRVSRGMNRLRKRLRPWLSEEGAP